MHTASSPQSTVTPLFSTDSKPPVKPSVEVTEGIVTLSFVMPDDGLDAAKESARVRVARQAQWNRLKYAPHKHDPHWWDVLGTEGKHGYEHHMLEQSRRYTVKLMPGAFLQDHSRTSSNLLDYGLGLNLDHPTAALVPELFWMLPHSDLQELGYRYVAAIHNRLNILGDHHRMFFQLGADFDEYFDPQREDYWKKGGLFAFLADK